MKSSMRRSEAGDLAGAAVSDVAIRRAEPGDVEALAALIGGFHCAWLGAEAVGYTRTRFLTWLWSGGVEAQLEDLFVLPSPRAASRSTRTRGTRSRSHSTAPRVWRRRHTRCIPAGGRFCG